MPLPSTNVNPGDLIRADLINAILVELRDLRSDLTSLQGLVEQAISEIKGDFGRLSRDFDGFKDVPGSLREVDRRYKGLSDKLDDLETTGLENLRKKLSGESKKQFDDFVMRYDKELSDVRVRAARDDDPVEFVFGQEVGGKLQAAGVRKVSQLKGFQESQLDTMVSDKGVRDQAKEMIALIKGKG